MTALTHYQPAYSPAVEDLARGLPEIGDALVSQLHELAARPTSDGAERLATNLQGACRVVLRLRESILAKGKDE